MSVKPGRVFQSLLPVDVIDPNQPLPLGPAGVLHGSLTNGIKWVLPQCTSMAMLLHRSICSCKFVHLCFQVLCAPLREAQGAGSYCSGGSDRQCGGRSK